MKKVNFDSYVDNRSIIVINQQGHLRKLYCPFRVLCVDSINTISVDTWCYVDSVELSSDAPIIYQIGGVLYPFHHFHIYIKF